MTFEQWWAAELSKQFPSPSPGVECQAKHIARAAWNAALDATWSASIWMANDPPTASHLCDTLNGLKVKP